MLVRIGNVGTQAANQARNALINTGKVWKTNAGRNSPFLPALAALPNHERERVRNQNSKFRTLTAFGETPDRWEWEVKNLVNNGDLLDPEADSQRLMGLWETRHDLIQELDAADHALDYLGELEKQGETSSVTGRFSNGVERRIVMPQNRLIGAVF